MKTQEQIVERFNEMKEDDFFGFEVSEYLSALDFEHAKPFLKDETTAEDWGSRPWTSSKGLKEDMVKYASFAWGKANDGRGISAHRSIAHYVAWLWMAEDEFFSEVERLFDTAYEHYGKGILVKICEHLGVDWKSLDDGQWRNSDIEEPGRNVDEILPKWLEEAAG